MGRQIPVVSVAVLLQGLLGMSAGADGTPEAVLSEDAGTTPYRMIESNGELMLARMDRVMQRLTVE